MQTFYIARNGNHEGPFTEIEIRAKFSQGELSKLDFVWAEGLQGWTKLCDVFADLAVEALDDFVPESLKPGQKRDSLTKWQQESLGCVYRLKEHDGILEVHEDHLTITPLGPMGFLYKGLKGAKTIQLSTITAIQLRHAGTLTRGYIQFTVPGGIENTGGLLEAASDENTFAFDDGSTSRAAVIKTYIETRIKELRNPSSKPPPAASLGDELTKLATLKSQGLLTDEEFQAAKKRLLDS